MAHKLSTIPVHFTPSSRAEIESPNYSINFGDNCTRVLASQSKWFLPNLWSPGNRFRWQDSQFQPVSFTLQEAWWKTGLWLKTARLIQIWSKSLTQDPTPRIQTSPESSPTRPCSPVALPPLAEWPASICKMNQNEGIEGGETQSNAHLHIHHVDLFMLTAGKSVGSWRNLRFVSNLEGRSGILYQNWGADTISLRFWWLWWSTVRNMNVELIIPSHRCGGHRDSPHHHFHPTDSLDHHDLDSTINSTNKSTLPRVGGRKTTFPNAEIAIVRVKLLVYVVRGKGNYPVISPSYPVNLHCNLDASPIWSHLCRLQLIKKIAKCQWAEESHVGRWNSIKICQTIVRVCPSVYLHIYIYIHIEREICI